MVIVLDPAALKPQAEAATLAEETQEPPNYLSTNQFLIIILNYEVSPACQIEKSEKSAAAGMDNTQGDAGKDDVTAVKNNDLLHRTGIKVIVC